MTFPLSSARASRLVRVDETGSTNADLLADAAAPDGSVLVTLSQTAGRGRLGRTWTAPPGRTLAASLLLDARRLGPDVLGWVPLVAGAAMRASVAAVVTRGEVGLKWPNDVQVDGLKAAGLLAELRPDGSAVVVGAGVNLALTADELPTPTSTSLGLHGAEGPPEALADRVLSAWLDGTRGLLAVLAAGDEPAREAVRAQVEAECTTIGRRVRVELPGGADLVGEAVRLDVDGRLVVRAPGRGDVAVASGDVTHLRYE